MNFSTHPNEPARLSRGDALFAVGCGAVALVNYFSCLSRTVGPGDSGELTLVALKLGIAHPPGYALFTWLGRIATFFPGEPAAATSTLTAVLAAAAVGFLFLAARAVGFTAAGSAVAALSLAFSATFWTAAANHEVYSLSILLLALVSFLCLRTDGSSRILLLAAFLFGLAVSHQPTALLWLPALALFAIASSGRVEPKRLVTLLLLFLLGFSASKGLIFRALSHPEPNWGDPSTLGRFLAHITGSQYGELAGSGARLLNTRLAGLPALLSAELGIPALVLAAPGIWYLFRSRRPILVGLLLLAATGLFGLAYNIPDFRVHLLPCFVAFAMLAGAGAGLLERYLGRLKPVLGAVAALAVLAAPGYTVFRNYPLARENRSTIVRDLGSNLLISLPPDAVFIAGSDVSANAVRYLQAVRNTRPDVLVVSADMLFSRPYHEWLGRQLAMPGYDAFLRTAGTGTRPERLQRLLEQLVDAAGERPVLLGTEMMNQDFFNGPVAGKRLVAPYGVVTRLLPPGDSVTMEEYIPANRRLWDSYQLSSSRETYSSPDFQQVQLVYAAARNNLGMFCLEREWREAAIENLRAALEMPAPPEVRQVFQLNLDRALARAI